MTLTNSLTALPDVDVAEHHARGLLEALGVDCDLPSRRTSPLRMAKAYLEMMSSDPFEMTTFDNDSGYTDLVLVTDIPFHSLCEHHFLPFTGVAHVGYLPDRRLVGLSKLARTVEMFARGPQTQEILTAAIAEHLDSALESRGVGVVMEAEHSCMSLRGVRTVGARTRTSAFTGALDSDRSEFLSALPR
ncbi:GTP cyclohydrolase I [Paramicrobacterium sp. CJ85]|uniref:GTP cyclohydrolase I n=1 Tax=Paramicrobacterium sp. CJ85 TaxID=3445355 RepID=UPI003F630E46